MRRRHPSPLTHRWGPARVPNKGSGQWGLFLWENMKGLVRFQAKLVAGESASSQRKILPHHWSSVFLFTPPSSNKSLHVPLSLKITFKYLIRCHEPRRKTSPDGCDSDQLCGECVLAIHPARGRPRPCPPRTPRKGKQINASELRVHGLLAGIKGHSSQGSR